MTITSASARVVNGPLTIIAASAGFDSTIINFPSRLITQYSAAKLTEHMAKRTANTNNSLVNFIELSPFFGNFPDLVKPGLDLLKLCYKFEFGLRIYE